MNIIIKNITVIMDIISAHQTLSKATGFEDICSINELINEALLISGLEIKKEITIEKQYGNLSPIKIDRVKILQILVNLIKNAKDALLSSVNLNKVLTITTSVVGDQIKIDVMDNGIGILPKNLDKIFFHGFTTKETGHGFGLHTTALAINELGGSIDVTSDGLEKGATFTIYVPYSKP